MCGCALATCVPNCIDRSARFFFMLETHGPQGAVGHVAAPKPTPVGRRGPEPQDTWQRRNPPQSGGKVQSHRTRGSVEVHLNQEVRSEDIGHVAASKPISAER
jgi:hypothetical protein